MVWRYDRYLNQECQSGLNHPQSLHVVQVSYPLHTQNAHNSGHVRRVSLGFPCQRPWWMPSLMYTWTLPGTRWHLATRAAFVRNRGSSRLMQRLEKKSLSLDISSPGRITLSFSWDNMRYSLQPSSQLTYYRNISTHQPVQFHPSKSPAAPAAPAQLRHHSHLDLFRSPFALKDLATRPTKDGRVYMFASL